MFALSTVYKKFLTKVLCATFCGLTLMTGVVGVFHPAGRGTPSGRIYPRLSTIIMG
jgi:hypothetical protein